eukprot:Pgem_evm1s14923
MEDIVGSSETNSAVQDSVSSMFGGAAKNSKVAEALARAQAINKSKNFKTAATLYKKKEVVIESQHHDNEIEINDFPQNARWKVTQR